MRYMTMREPRMNNQKTIKEENIKTLFSLISSDPGVTRAQLGRITALSPTTVSTLVDERVQRGLVLEGKEQVRRAELGTGKYSRSMANQKKLLTIPSGRLTVSQAERVEARARSAPKQGERTGWSRPWIACTEAWNCRQPKGAWINSSPGCATAAWSQ